MQFIGRKLYIPLSPDFTVAITRFGKRWSKFRPGAFGAYLEASHLGHAEGLGDEFQVGSTGSEQVATSALRLRLNKLRATDLDQFKVSAEYDWVVGQKLLMTWNQHLMIGIEGIQRPNLDKNLRPHLRDVYEFDSELFERERLHPSKVMSGSLEDIVLDTACWLTAEESVARLNHIRQLTAIAP